MVNQDTVTKTFTGSTKKTYSVPAPDDYQVIVERKGWFWGWSTIADEIVTIN